MGTIRITDLKLRTIIGINDWEREELQDVRINVEIEFDESASVKSDDIKDTVDYKTLSKEIIHFVENSEFFLLEKLTDGVLDIIMKAPKVLSASVRIDKPQALRFSESVSVELSRSRK